MPRRRSTVKKHFNVLFAQAAWIERAGEKYEVTQSALMRAALAMLQGTEACAINETVGMVRGIWADLRMFDDSGDPGYANGGGRDDGDKPELTGFRPDDERDLAGHRRTIRVYRPAKSGG